MAVAKKSGGLLGVLAGIRTDSKLKVNYVIHVDPGGQIPTWIANLFSTQGPYETFKNLKDRLEHQKDKVVESHSLD